MRRDVRQGHHFLSASLNVSLDKLKVVSVTFLDVRLGSICVCLIKFLILALYHAMTCLSWYSGRLGVALKEFRNTRKSGVHGRFTDVYSNILGPEVSFLRWVGALVDVLFLKLKNIH